MPDSLRQIEREIVACRKCPRLVEHREHIAKVKRRAYANDTYWGRPVPGFGDARARVVLVGLAPGAHGSNRTGRMFTGDASGDFLYPTLHRFGYATRPDAEKRGDGMRLRDCFITAAARCAPPGNKPTTAELDNCRPYMERELVRLTRARVYVALGRHGFDALLRVLPTIGFEPRGGGDARKRRPAFGHDVAHIFEFRSENGGSRRRVEPRTVVCSYHPSQQNTQTGRLTQKMFDRVFRRVSGLIDTVSSTASRA